MLGVVRPFARKAMSQGCIGSVRLRYGNLTEDGDVSAPFLNLGSEMFINELW